MGKLACFCGTHEERSRGKDYMQWLLMQRTGTVSCDFEVHSNDLKPLQSFLSFVCAQGRDDVTTLEVPSQSVGFITGHRGDSLRRVESATECFCFTNGGRQQNQVLPPNRKLLKPKPCAIGRHGDRADILSQQRLPQKGEAHYRG